MKIKKLISIILCIVMVCTVLPVSAEEPITVLLNGEELSFDVPPQIIDNRTMVPMRGIFEALGAEVQWNPDDRTILAGVGETTVRMQIENSSMTINNEVLTLDVPPQIVDGRTLVPVRAVAESFDAFVNWNAEARTVFIVAQSPVSVVINENNPYVVWSSNDPDSSSSSTPFVGYDFGKDYPDTSLSADPEHDASNEVFLPEPDQAPVDTRKEETPAPVVSEEEVYKTLLSFKDEYPEGMHWTNDNYYSWKGGVYSVGYGCAAFAFMLSDAAFGEKKAKIISGDLSVDQLKVGDIVWLNSGSHSVIVLEVREHSFVVAEGNYNSSIHWGRELSEEVLKDAKYIMTRY